MIRYFIIKFFYFFTTCISSFFSWWICYLWVLVRSPIWLDSLSIAFHIISQTICFSGCKFLSCLRFSLPDFHNILEWNWNRLHLIVVAHSHCHQMMAKLLANPSLRNTFEIRFSETISSKPLWNYRLPNWNPYNTHD